MEWIDIEQEKPNPHKPVMIYYGASGIIDIAEMVSENRFISVISLKFISPNITHWAPLPPPPLVIADCWCGVDSEVQYCDDIENTVICRYCDTKISLGPAADEEIAIRAWNKMQESLHAEGESDE